MAHLRQAARVRARAFSSTPAHATLPRVMARLLFNLALITLATACARSVPLLKWEEDFYFAERLHDDGQRDLARERFAQLRKSAKDPRDADEAALMACETQARANAFGAATACYDALSTDAFDGDVRARAFMHAGELRLYDLGQTELALRMFQTLIERKPSAAATQRALDHLYLYGKQHATQRDGLIAWMLRMERQAPETDIADNLLLRAAMLMDLADTAMARQDAVNLLERLEKLHPEVQTIIDAMMLHARLERALGHAKAEALELERVVATYETSYNFASYVLSEHTLASLRLIELYRGELQDLKRAEWHARNLPEMLRTPLKMPQFMLELAAIEEQRGDLRAAIDTCQDVLAYVRDRNDDFAEDDRRICHESETRDLRKACLEDLKGRAPVEEKEVRLAREMIERLQVAMRSASLRGGRR